MDLAQALRGLNMLYEIPAEDTEQLYVSRPDQIAERLAASLTGVSRWGKVLLAGQHGIGKTTELNRMAQLVSGTYHVVRCRGREMIDMDDAAGEVDFLLVLIRTLITHAKDQGTAISEAITQTLSDVLRPIPGLNAKLSEMGLLGSGGKPGAPGSGISVASKELVSFRTELISAVHRTMEALEGVEERPVLLIVDDLEKVEYSQVRRLFDRYSVMLASLPCAALFTIPPWLMFDGELLARLRDHFQIVDMANVALNTPDGELLTPRVEFLGEVINRRMVPPVQSQGRLPVWLLVFASGGNLRQCIGLFKTAVHHAINAGEATIDFEQASLVIRDRETDFRRTVRLQDRDLLLAIAKEMHYNVEFPPYLLTSLCVLEYYYESETWYGINPLAFPVIGRKSAVDFFKDISEDLERHAKAG